VLFGADGEARPVAIDQKNAHAAPPGRRLGARQHDREVADRGVVDPELGAAQAPAVGGPLGAGANRRNVRAGLGLGDRVGRAPHGAKRRPEIASALLRGAMSMEQRRDQLDQAALVGDRRVAARQLLHDNRVGEGVHAGATELGRQGDAEQAELGHAGIDLRGKPLLLVELADDRADRLIGEAADQVAHLPVLGRDGHRSRPVVCWHDFLRVIFARPTSGRRPLGDGHTRL
jgi:hypothetical protein